MMKGVANHGSQGRCQIFGDVVGDCVVAACYGCEGDSLFVNLGQSIDARDGLFWIWLVVLWFVNGLVPFTFLE